MSAGVSRFGKASDHMFSIKADYFASNERLLARAQELAKLYVKQPPRTHCKNCASPLAGERFVKGGVEYIVCGVDGHLNGVHEDTDEYARAVYTEEGGKAYAQTYQSADREAFRKRVETIYRPKVDFLFEELEKEGVPTAETSFGELGAGAGYFLAALEDRGVSCTGYDVSVTQARLAEEMLGRAAVVVHDLHEVVPLARKIEAQVLAMIGTLEHLQRPREVLEAIVENESVEYLFLQLPLFSPSVMLEAALPDMWPRQLSAGHTHLFTERSLDHMYKEFGFSPCATWWFGVDIMDLLRGVFVRLESDQNTSSLASQWMTWMKPLVDPLQLVVDQAKLSSQLHVLLKRTGADG